MTWSDSPPPGRPYPKGKYDPIAARIYFDSRPLQVLSRSVTITVKSLSFAMKLAQDKFIGGADTWQKNQEQRGLELAQLLTELGPTFIKIGQSLSIRADILSPAYIKGLSSLQDNVPAFDTATAIEILEEEWGVPVGDVLEGGLLESAKPVAAASLGQVYKAQLKGSGVEVAIKVQRPKITTQIALDMHLLREFAPIARRTFNLATDTEGTVDAWGSGFVDELDYLQEASNGKYFSEQILKTSLKDVVLAPEVIDEYTSGKVLVTGWVDGERLDRSSQEDVSVLCSICMNTYLSMMLEMGMLHCDPHPGNLLRTPDGKLCILDWGMVTTLPPGLQLTLLEHMAHLTSGDYAEVPRDLYLLGFVPADKEKVIEDSGVVDVLADIYGQWTSGGGMASINANDVLVQIQDLASTRGNLFQIPPYFAYIAKSFSVLEGIGLSNDSKYSIINECLPYISNRLLTDQ
ncbi:ABC1-domain-containing protein, partial [Fragilariopsis cylindrus CCMP1102]